MSAPRTWQFNLPSDQRPSDASFPEAWYPGIQSTWSGCTTPRKYDPIEGIRAVVIHATAGSSTSGAISVMKAGKASFHWIVPDEDEEKHGALVWACAPEAKAAWHVRNACSHPDVWGGEDHVNHFSLGIEIVNAQISSDQFSNWQVQITADVVRYCWAKYPNLKHVVSHARLDPERRTDPGTNFPWSRFKDLVLTGGVAVANLAHVAHVADIAETTSDPCGECA